MKNQPTLAFGRFVRARTNLPEADRSLLLEIGHPLQLKKHAFLLREGDICCHVYFIEKGLFSTSMRKDGREIILNFVEENNFITGLRSFRDQVPSPTQICALEPSRVLAFRKEDLMKLYPHSREIALLGKALLEELLTTQEEHAKLFKIRSAAERYRYFDIRYPGLSSRVAPPQLSSYLGISPDALSRIRSDYGRG